jgi:O-antigen/teichoic acid export membrane protein
MSDNVSGWWSRGYLLYLLPSIAQGGIGLALVPVTTHYLDPVDFGVYALLIAVVMPVRAFAASGARWVIGGNYFSAGEVERRAMLFNVLAFEFVLRATLILLLYVFAEPALRWLVTDYRPEYRGYLHILLVATLAGSLWPTVSFLMTVRNHPHLFALYSLIQTLVSAAATLIFLVAFGWGVEALFAAMLASACASVMLELLYVRRQVDFSFRGKWLREVVGTGLKAAPGGLAEVVSNMADRLAIQRWAGLGNLGIYSHSQQYQSIFKMFTAALSNTLMNDSLRIYSRDLDPAPIERLLAAWYGMLALMGVGVALFSDDAIALLTHGKFTGAAPLVQIWFLSVFSVSHSIPYANFLMARKRNRVLMYTQLLPTLAGIGLVVAGTRVFGIFGAAWAILLTNVAIQASRRLAARRLGYRGVAERRFAEALLLFGGLWLADNMLALSVAVEAVACLILVPGVVLRFDLIGEMKHVLSARAGQCAAE